MHSLLCTYNKFISCISLFYVCRYECICKSGMYMCTNPIRSLRTKAPRPYGASWRWRQPCGNCWLCLESLPASCMHGLMCGRSAARLTAELKVSALGRAYGRSYIVYVCRNVTVVGQRNSWPTRPRSIRDVLSLSVAHTFLFPTNYHHANIYRRCEWQYCIFVLLYVCIYVSIMYVWACALHFFAETYPGHRQPGTFIQLVGLSINSFQIFPYSFIIWCTWPGYWLQGRW